MAEKIGVETIKKAIRLGLDLAKGISDALANDGKISFFETLGLVGKTFPIAELINKRKQLVEELKDLEQDEKTELYIFVQATYNIPYARVEPTVEKALELFFNLLDFSLEMTEIWRKP